MKEKFSRIDTGTLLLILAAITGWFIAVAHFIDGCYPLAGLGLFIGVGIPLDLRFGWTGKIGAKDTTDRNSEEEK